MGETIYSLLNGDAKAWWYHRQLRQQGQAEEARKRERQSIKSGVEMLRNAYFWSVGEGGWSIYGRSIKTKYGSTSSKLEGYGGVDAPKIRAAIKLGVPGYDFRTIPKDRQIKACLQAPLVDETRDEPREDGSYGSLSYAPPRVVLAWYGSHGATIYNAENADIAEG